MASYFENEASRIWLFFKKWGGAHPDAESWSQRILPWSCVCVLTLAKMWASPKKAGVRYEQGFFLEVRKRPIWDSLKRSRLSEGSFPDRVGRGSLPTAQTAMYPWEKPS